MKRWPRLRCGVLVASALACVSIAKSAHGGAPEEARALELKARGDQAFEAGRPAIALEAYVEAYQLSRDPALLYNKGRALQALTDYPRALEELEAFDREAPPELKQRVRGLSRIIDEVRSKVSKLTLHCPEGAAVRLRDRSLGACPFAAPLVVNAGRGTLEVTKEGHDRWSRDVDLPGAGAASFDIVLAERSKEPPSTSVLSRWWFWTGLAVVVGAGVAVTVALTTERAPREGTVAPGVVSAGLEGAGFRF